jgi:hypothetical protein
MYNLGNQTAELVDGWVGTSQMYITVYNGVDFIIYNNTSSSSSGGSSDILQVSQDVLNLPNTINPTEDDIAEAFGGYDVESDFIDAILNNRIIQFVDYKVAPIVSGDIWANSIIPIKTSSTYIESSSNYLDRVIFIKEDEDGSIIYYNELQCHRKKDENYYSGVTMSTIPLSDTGKDENTPIYIDANIFNESSLTSDDIENYLSAYNENEINYSDIQDAIVNNDRKICFYYLDSTTGDTRTIFPIVQQSSSNTQSFWILNAEGRNLIYIYLAGNPTTDDYDNGEVQKYAISMN